MIAEVCKPGIAKGSFKSSLLFARNVVDVIRKWTGWVLKAISTDAQKTIPKVALVVQKKDLRAATEH